MDIRFQAGGSAAWKADVAIVFALPGDEPLAIMAGLDEGAPWLGISPAWRDVTGRKGESVVLYGPPASDVPRVLALGLGGEGELTLKQVRHALGTALRQCRERGWEHVGLALPSLARLAGPLGVDAPALAREAVLAALLGLYRYDRWLSDKSGQRPDPRAFSLLLEERHVPDALRDSARLGEAEALALCLARDLANGPANVVTPSFMAESAAAVAGKYGMSCRSLGREEMAELGFGALLAVARGAKQEPRLVVMEYTPGGTEGREPFVLIGKGITFDSGGISLKPSAGMQEMKGDMSGAAAVLGVMEALGSLGDAGGAGVSRPVVALLPCTENMPGGNATRPGDIVIAKSGLSVEIVNTDAEGRLVLADAMAYAQELWKPALMIDIATLTGACVVALGKDAAGLFCDDDARAERMRAAGERLGERAWRLPLWDDATREALKSEVADMVNSGPREGGAIHAAGFLKRFVKPETPWVHLDIAATDHTESPINAKGGSGFGVRTLLETLLTEK